MGLLSNAIISVLFNGSFLLHFGTHPQVLISSTFYEQLFSSADPKSLKKLTTWLSFLRFRDLHV